MNSKAIESDKELHVRHEPLFDDMKYMGNDKEAAAAYELNNDHESLLSSSSTFWPFKEGRQETPQHIKSDGNVHEGRRGRLQRQPAASDRGVQLRRQRAPRSQRTYPWRLFGAN